MHEALGLTVFAALSSSNLGNICGILVQARLKVLICADFGETGQKDATAAAQKYGCRLVNPTFPLDKSGKDFNDFNDLHRLAGTQEVSYQISAGWRSEPSSAHIGSEKPPDLEEAPGGVGDLERIEDGTVTQDLSEGQDSLSATKSSMGEDIAPLEPFPVHLLPPVARAIAEEVASVTRLPMTLPGVVALGFLSAAIGSGLRVRSGPDRTTCGNLYLVISALSGTGKSEAFRHISAPFYAVEHKMAEHWKQNDLPNAQADVDLLESEIGGLKRDAARCDDSIERENIRLKLRDKKKALLGAQEKLAVPAMSCEDTTTDRLAVLLQNNNEQLASLSSDAGSILNNLLGRYNKLDRTDEGLYLKAFSGDRVRVDRIGRPPVWLESPFLSALWLAQPDKVDTMLSSDSLKGGGLVPRLLMCHSHAEPQYVVEGATGIPESVTKDWADLVEDLIRTFRLAAEPGTIHPTPEALRRFNDHANYVVDRRRADLKDVSIFASRWNEQAWRIAVCLHAGLHGTDAGRHDLNETTANNAILLAGWFAMEQLGILALGREAAIQAQVDQVTGLLTNKPAGITTRDLCRARITSNAEGARTLLARLEAEGELIGHGSQPGTGGHVTKTFVKA